MDALACHQPPPVQIIRDRKGLVLGRLEAQSSTGKIVARDARGLLVATFDPRAGVTRDRRGLVVARGDALAAFLLCP